MTAFFYIFSSKFANRWAAEPSTGTLTLSNLQLEDFGLFQCLVQNKVSEHYVVSLLVVTGASHNSVFFRSLLKVMPNSTCVFAKQRQVRIHRILTNQIQGILYLANRLQDQAARLLPCFLLVTGFCCTDLSGYWQMLAYYHSEVLCVNIAFSLTFQISQVYVQFDGFISVKGTISLFISRKKPNMHNSTRKFGYRH